MARFPFQCSHTPSIINESDKSRGRTFSCWWTATVPAGTKDRIKSVMCRIPLPSHVPGLETGTADDGAEQVGAVRGRERGEGGR